MKKYALPLLLIVFLAATAAVSRLPFAAAESEPALAAAETAVADLPLLVNRDRPLPDGYEPQKLVNLYDLKRQFKLANSGIKLEEHVYIAMNEMFAAANADGVKDFIVTSGYRTAKKQKQLYDDDTKGIAAAPGQSEHQTGLAFDVVTPGVEGKFHTTEQFKWISEHCYEYGFILRYPQGKEEITGFPPESWHYRYVGVEAAMAMKESGETLEEYWDRLSGAGN